MRRTGFLHGSRDCCCKPALDRAMQLLVSPAGRPAANGLLRTQPDSGTIMTFTVRRSLAALSLGIAALGLSAPALATDGYFLNGVGAAAKGAGGVAIAMPQDGLAIVSNPAAATEVGKRIDIGAELFVPRRGATISGNGAGLNGTWSGNGANPFVLPEASFVHPLRGGRFAVAIAISGNGGMNTHYKANPFASFGATGPAGVNLRQISVSPTLAMRVAEGHSIGVSPVLVIQSFKAHGIQPFAAFSQDPANVSNRGTDWTLGGGLRLGYLGSIGDAVKVGGFYQTNMPGCSPVVAASKCRKPGASACRSSRCRA